MVPGPKVTRTGYEQLLVFAAGTIVRAELNKDQVRAGDGHSPAQMRRVAAKKLPAIPEITSSSWPFAPQSRPAHRPADKTAMPVAPSSRGQRQ